MPTGNLLHFFKLINSLVDNFKYLPERPKLTYFLYALNFSKLKSFRIYFSAFEVGEL